jgi:hypothetical protein
MAWIALADDSNGWWALVNDVLNIRFRKTAGNFLIN